eukprot:m.271247 g.271247  ORF g.271247 m.271247 type:complete len:616 (-) comp26872_c0_seq1:41-1888(-)
MVGMAFALLSVAACAATGMPPTASPSCTVVDNMILGSKPVTIAHVDTKSAAECCQRCQEFQSARCTVWTWEGRGNSKGTCFLKNSTLGAISKQGATSGCVSAADCVLPTPPPSPPPNPNVRVEVDAASVLSRTDPGFKSWNIDASPNREWETRDLSNPLLASLGRQSVPGYLRFGGAGNDGLPYALDMSDPASAGNQCVKGSIRCLNRTWVDNLCGFASNSGAKLVFGLNINVCTNPDSDSTRLEEPLANPCAGRPWDPTESRALMQYLIKANHTIFGFELGNEQNTNYEPHVAAANFKILSDLLVELYPDSTQRPKIIGPDVHGFHGDPLTSPAEIPKLRYLKEFAPNCSDLGVPLHAATHHEYVDVDENPLGPPTVEQLNITQQIASAVNATLASVAPAVQIWAGEIGPHNGGSVACDHSEMRWANFADSFWYLDSLGVKAANGYSVFCRQDFVGIDYGMIDCSTYAPLPDYYAGILWSRLMGTAVLRAASSSATLRVYSHCSPTPAAGMTVLLLNLDPVVARNVTLAGVDGAHRVEWHLTGPGGANGTQIALNGKLLEAVVKGGTEYVLPSLEGNAVAPSPGAPTTVEMAPASIVFVQFSGAGLVGVCDSVM